MNHPEFVWVPRWLEVLFFWVGLLLIQAPVNPILPGAELYMFALVAGTVLAVAVFATGSRVRLIHPLTWRRAPRRLAGAVAFHFMIGLLYRGVVRELDVASLFLTFVGALWLALFTSHADENAREYRSEAASVR